VLIKAGRRTILYVTISCQGGGCGTVDCHGVVRLLLVDRCANDVKRVETLCSERVLSKVNDCAEITQCGWRQDGILRNLMFVTRHGG